MLRSITATSETTRPTTRPTVGFGEYATPFDPESLFSAADGEWWETGDLSSMFTDSAGTVPVASDGDPVGCWKGKRASGYDFLQADTGTKPLFNAANNLIRFYADRGMNIATFPWPANDADYSVFVFYRASSGTAGGGSNQYLFAPRDGSYLPQGGYAVATNFGTPGIKGESGGAISWDYSGVENQDQFRSVTYIARTAKHLVYYNDDGVDLETGSNTGRIGTTHTDAVVGYGSSVDPEYQVKMILVIRRVLTVGEIADLYAYAGAL